jgi:transposase
VCSALAGLAVEQIATIALESGAAVHLARQLSELGYPVTIFDARAASKFLKIRRNKTDASDARALADLARLEVRGVSRVHLKSLDVQRLRTQLQMRQKLVELRIRVDGMMRSLVRLHGGKLPILQTASRVSKIVLEEAARIKAAEGVDLQQELMPLVNLAVALRGYLNQTDQRIRNFTENHPVCRRLRTITGVGPICALSFYSAIENPANFSRSSSAAAYLGLTPRIHQSGATSYARGISKMGNKLTRTHLVTAAAVILKATSRDSDLKRWGLQIAERAGRPRARIAVARKLAVIMLAVWRDETEYKPMADQPGSCARKSGSSSPGKRQA